MPRRGGLLVIALGLLSTGVVHTPTAGAESVGGICPPGRYAVGNRCVPGKAPAPRREEMPREERVVTTTLPCAEFNARFSSFHKTYSQKFGGQTRLQDQTEDRLKHLIMNQKRLHNELRRQSMNSRDVRIRRHLRDQARTVSEQLRQHEKELKEIEAGNQKQQEKWTDNYQRLARDFLKKRPKGCKVSVVRSN